MMIFNLYFPAIIFVGIVVVFFILNHFKKIIMEKWIQYNMQHFVYFNPIHKSYFKISHEQYNKYILPCFMFMGMLMIISMEDIVYYHHMPTFLSAWREKMDYDYEILDKAKRIKKVDNNHYVLFDDHDKIIPNTIDFEIVDNYYNMCKTYQNLNQNC